MYSYTDRDSLCTHTLHCNALGYKRSEGPGGGYSLIIAIRVCAAQRGRIFGTPNLKQGIIFKPFSKTGYRSEFTGFNFSNARKLQNIIGNFNSRTGY